ncbi:MAG: hypothetical protein ABEJ28_04810 [Salinigranum sp.]
MTAEKTDGTPLGRRGFLRLAGGTATLGVAGLAGCTGTANVPPGSDSIAYMAGQTGLPKVVGGPNDLTGTAKVKMVAMQGNEGHGYSFLPSVVWLKPGGTVKWMHQKTGASKKVSHTVTALNSENDKPQLTPKGSAGFDSGVLQMAFQSSNPQLAPGTNADALQGQYMHHRYGKRPNMGGVDNAFQGPYVLKFAGSKFPKGVYLYLCEDHDFLGMAGAVVVGDVGPGDPGWSPAMTKPLPSGFPKPLHDRFSWIRNRIESQVNG